MSADADTPHGGRVLSKDRMEGFSDGVFGFAMISAEGPVIFAMGLRSTA